MRSILFTTILFMTSSLLAQEANPIKRLNFVRGEVIDVIVSTPFPNTSSLIERYKETAFPVAFEYSYQLQPSFEIEELILGNYKPRYIIFGKWKNMDLREAFLANIVDRVPDFHEQRKAIFDGFKLTYFEIDEEIDAYIDTDKYNVVTSLWRNEKESFESFLNSWNQDIQEKGGKHLVRLDNGKSPIGYGYAPDLLFVTQWESKDHFEKFLDQNPLSSYSDLKDVHQFSIIK